MPSGADWSRMFSRLRSVRNVSVLMLSATNSAMNASTIPRSSGISKRRRRVAARCAASWTAASLLI